MFDLCLCLVYTFIYFFDKHEIVLDADSGAHAEHVMPRGKRTAPPGAVSLGGAAPDLRRVHMPYTFKLMQQELFGIGIGTKLVLDESEDVMCRPKINSELDAILGLPDLHSSHIYIHTTSLNHYCSMVRLSSQFSPLGPVFRDVIANKNNVSSASASDALEKAQAAKTSTTQTVAG